MLSIHIQTSSYRLKKKVKIIIFTHVPSFQTKETVLIFLKKQPSSFLPLLWEHLCCFLQKALENHPEVLLALLLPTQVFYKEFINKKLYTYLLKRFKVHCSSQNIDQFNWNKLLKFGQKKFIYLYFLWPQILIYNAYIAIYKKVITQFQFFKLKKLSYSPFQCDYFLLRCRGN